MIWQILMQLYMNESLSTSNVCSLWEIEGSRSNWLNLKLKDRPCSRVVGKTHVLSSNQTEWKQVFERCMIRQRMLIDNSITSWTGQVSRNGSRMRTITSSYSPFFITAKVFWFLMNKAWRRVCLFILFFNEPGALYASSFSYYGFAH